MGYHFRAFSFVDRITSIEHARRVRGSYTIPAGVPDFPLALIGEAVGQLAAWAAMAGSDFRQRPVAGLAGRIELQREVGPGQVVELAADLENVEADSVQDSVQYSGTAHVDGALVVRLTDCVGPMMPIAEFDDPEALRRRFRQLRGPGADGEGFPGLPQLAVERTGGEEGRYVSASFQVPGESPLFADHFPRRAVFPGSLLMHVTLQLAVSLASEIPPPARGDWMPAEIQDMKLRSFIPPGANLQLRARLKHRADDSAILAVEARNATEVLATTGLLLKPGGRA